MLAGLSDAIDHIRCPHGLRTGPRSRHVPVGSALGETIVQMFPGAAVGVAGAVDLVDPEVTWSDDNIPVSVTRLPEDFDPRLSGGP